MDVNSLVQTVAIYALPVLFAITLHEAAHGYVARHFGDMTAHAEGRISLNPLRHVDLNGTVIVPLVLIALSGGKFAFGWAKPVPVNYSALRLKSVIELPRGFASMFLFQMAVAGIVVNLVIMAINLLPILPLDGGRILVGLLPRGLAREYARTERWGGYVLMAFIGLSLLDAWLYDGRYMGGVFAPLGILIDNVLRTVVGR